MGKDAVISSSFVAAPNITILLSGMLLHIVTDAEDDDIVAADAYT